MNSRTPRKRSILFVACLIASIGSLGIAQSQDTAARFSDQIDALFNEAFSVEYKVYYQSLIWEDYRAQYEKDGTIPEHLGCSSSPQVVYGEDMLYKRDPSGVELLRFTQVELPLDPVKHAESISTVTITLAYNGEGTYILSEPHPKDGKEPSAFLQFRAGDIDQNGGSIFRYPTLAGLCITGESRALVPVGQALGKEASVLAKSDTETWLNGVPSSIGQKVDILVDEGVEGLEIRELVETFEQTDNYRKAVVIDRHASTSRGALYPQQATYTLEAFKRLARIATTEVVNFKTITHEERETEFTLVLPEYTTLLGNEIIGERLQDISSALALLTP